MNSFYFSKWFKSLSHNAMILSEKNDFNEIKKCIDMATCYGRITISTRAFARGIDFVVEEKKVRDAGGVHVIQTFTCENVSESVHI
jgi:preprotein translocase subunit SecA